MGPRATVSLRQATTAYLTATGRPTLTGLLDHISEIENAGRGLDAAREPLELLTSLVHCGNQPLGLNLNTSGLIVLDLAQIADQNLCKLLIELLLQAIWTAHTDNQPPLILVLDECQRLNWGTSSMSIRILREGRKFGIGGWFSSQYLDHKEAAAALGQAALQAHFRPDGRHIIKLAKHLSATRPADLPKYQQFIQGLHRGQFLWQQPDGKPVIVTVRD